MKRRIVKYKNGIFGIQFKFLWFWLGEDDFYSDRLFPTFQEAKAKVDEIMKNDSGGFKVAEVVWEEEE